MKMTAQQVFNKAYLGVICQGDVCKNDSGRCFYRHPKKLGFACAVGQLLDNKTARAIEKLEFPAISNVAKYMLPDHLRDHTNLLHEIQVAHDGTAHMQTPEYRLEDFKRRMQIVAKRNNLEVLSI